MEDGNWNLEGGRCFARRSLSVGGKVENGGGWKMEEVGRWRMEDGRMEAGGW